MFARDVPARTLLLAHEHVVERSHHAHAPFDRHHFLDSSRPAFPSDIAGELLQSHGTFTKRVTGRIGARNQHDALRRAFGRGVGGFHHRRLRWGVPSLDAEPVSARKG